METMAYNTNGNLRLVESSGIPEIPLSTPNISLKDHVSQLTRLLQTTLHLNEQMEFLSKQSKKLIGTGNLLFQNKDKQIDIKIGKKARNSAHYDLRLEGKHLGEITVTRTQRFVEQDLEKFEALLSTLPFPIRNALTFHQVQEEASKDALTGILNRGTLDKTLKREMDLATRHETPISLLMLDIDNFKAINDTFGHDVGDNVIKSITEIASDTIRSSDLLFRYGGEEFVVISRHKDKIGSLLLAERIRKNIERTCRIDNEELKVTISIGVATSQPNETDQHILKRADRALYQAKNNGRNQTVNVN